MRTRSHSDPAQSLYASSYYLFDTWEKRYGMWFQRELETHEYVIEEAIKMVVQMASSAKGAAKSAGVAVQLAAMDAAPKVAKAVADAAATAVTAGTAAKDATVTTGMRAAKATGHYALAAASKGTGDLANATARWHRQYDELMYPPNTISEKLLALLPERLRTFLNKAVGRLGLAALVTVAVIVGLRHHDAVRRTVLSFIGLNSREQTRAIRYVQDSTRVPVSVKNMPKALCYVDLEVAATEMMKQERAIELSNPKESLKLKIPASVAKSNKCSLKPVISSK